MARQRLIDAPPRNDVYTGMLAVTCLAVLTGIVVLLLEFGGDYDFEQAPKPGASVSLPKDYSRPAPKSDGTAPATTPAPAPMTKAAPPAVAPELPTPAVAATPKLPTPVVPVPVEVAKPPAQPVEPAVVRPGFTPRFPR